MIELVITACLTTQPDKCSELRLPTGFVSVANCEVNAMILVAGVMLSRRELEAHRYRCVDADKEADT